MMCRGCACLTCYSRRKRARRSCSERRNCIAWNATTGSTNHAYRLSARLSHQSTSSFSIFKRHMHWLQPRLLLHPIQTRAMQAVANTTIMLTQKNQNNTTIHSMFPRNTSSKAIKQARSKKKPHLIHLQSTIIIQMATTHTRITKCHTTKPRLIRITHLAIHIPLHLTPSSYKPICNQLIRIPWKNTLLLVSLAWLSRTNLLKLINHFKKTKLLLLRTIRRLLPKKTCSSHLLTKTTLLLIITTLPYTNTSTQLRVAQIIPSSWAYNSLLCRSLR
jgi:hypothetical protein